MDTLRLGRQLRALRRRARLTQAQLGSRAGVSRASVGRIERGAIATVPCGKLSRCAEALGATLETSLRWRGEGLDRLLDEEHAAIVDAAVALYRAAGWEVAVEASFSIDGERGSIDVFAWHPPTASVAVTEIKSVVPDSQATLHVLDRKARLAARIARERGWTCSNVSRVLVVGESRTSRRRVERHASMFAAAFPVRGRAVLGWIRRPSGRPIAGLLFLAPPRRASPAGGRERVSRAPR
jgi:transcriptional regulator with XRE-family HTH domain